MTTAYVISMFVLIGIWIKLVYGTAKQYRLALDIAVVLTLITCLLLFYELVRTFI